MAVIYKSKTSRVTMHIPRKPGELIEVDWAGDPAHIIDPDTGEITDARIFVGVLTYSQYAYVEAFVNEQTQAWITAHIHMYEFFGGVSRILVSDNCTTAVDRKQSDWYTPKLNQTCEAHRTAILSSSRSTRRQHAAGGASLNGTGSQKEGN